MRDFDDFDPGAWTDGVFVVVHHSPENPVVEKARDGLKTLQSHLYTTLAATGIALSALAFAAMGASTHAQVAPLTSSVTSVSVKDDKPPLLNRSVEETWKVALAELAAEGEDVDALLSQAADNLDYWHGRDDLAALQQALAEEDV